jgi:hypothetical protein
MRRLYIGMSKYRRSESRSSSTQASLHRTLSRADVTALEELDDHLVAT